MDTSFAEQIHQASLQLLADPGVRFEHDAIYELLLKRGAKPGNDAHVVRIPEEMVEQYLQLCPKRAMLHNRLGEPTEITCNSDPIFWSVPGINLYRRGELRPFRLQDMEEMTRLLDQLSNVAVVFGVSLDDIPPPARDVVGLRAMAENTAKHIRVLCFAPRSMDIMLEMRSAIGDYNWFSIGFTAHGPLRWTHLALDVFRRTAGHGIPTTVNGEPMAGTSAPVTLAGTAAVGNAEILAGIVVNQILEPGRPCIYNFGLAHTFDMKTGIAVTGGPENALFARVSAIMGRFYLLPSASWVSSEAMSPDAQAALEKMFGFRTHSEAGVGCIWGVGQLESELTFSPAQAVIDDEMIAFNRRYSRGISLSDSSLAVDLTRAVGIAGSFLDRDHTLEHFRTELFEPSVLFRKRRANWVAEGRQSLEERAEDLADELIRRPVRHPLDDAVKDTLAALVADYGAQLEKSDDCTK